MSSFINLIQGRKDFFWLKKEFKKDILEKRKQAIELKKQSETILDGYEMLRQLGMKIIKDNKSTK